MTDDKIYTEEDILNLEMLASYRLDYAPGRWNVVVAALALCFQEEIPPQGWIVEAVDEMAKVAPSFAGRKGPTEDLRTNIVRYRAIRRQMFKNNYRKKKEDGDGRGWRPTKEALQEAIKEIEGEYDHRRNTAYLESYDAVAQDLLLQAMSRDLALYPRIKTRPKRPKKKADQSLRSKALSTGKKEL